MKCLASEGTKIGKDWSVVQKSNCGSAPHRELRVKIRAAALLLRLKFTHLREWCGEHLWSPGCCHSSVGQGGGIVENVKTSSSMIEIQPRA